MSDVYTAAELAALRLPGLPASARAIRRLATRESWPTVPVATNGGTALAYPRDALPARTRARLGASEATPVVDAWSVSEKLRGVANDRLSAVIEISDKAEAGMKIKRAIEEAATRCGTPERTVRRWFDTVKDSPRHDWLSLLTPRWTNPRAQEQLAQIDDRAWDAFRSEWLRPSKPALTACYRRVAAIAKRDGWGELPSLRTFQRRLESTVDDATITYHREGRDALARLYPAQTRTRDHLGALQAVTADGHKIDVMVQWPGEVAPTRVMMLAVQDLGTGKILGWRIDRGENADLVRLVFGDVVRAWGIPDAVYFDNGRAFASKWITGGANWRFRFKVKSEEPTGLLTQLGTVIHWTTPYHGQAKPIERAFRDLAENIGKHPFCEGAYVGNSVANKPHNYGERAIPLDAFLQHVGAQVEEHNARPGRKAVDGKSFDQAFLESYARSPIRKATQEQQRLFLLAAESTKARKENGDVYILGTRYWSEKLTAWKGQSVTVRFDPHALANGVHVYDQEGTYITHAEAIGTVRFDDSDAARSHARARSEYVKARAKVARAEVTLSAADLAQLHTRTEATPATPASKVIRPVFGKRAAPELAESPGLASRDSRERKAKADALFKEVTESARNLVPRRRTPLAAGE